MENIMTKPLLTLIGTLVLAANSYAATSAKAVKGFDGLSITCTKENLGQRGFVVSEAKVVSEDAKMLKLSIQVKSVECSSTSNGTKFMSKNINEPTKINYVDNNGSPIVITSKMISNEIVLYTEPANVIAVAKYTSNDAVEMSVDKSAVNGSIDLFVRGIHVYTADKIAGTESEPYASGFFRVFLK
jgi:hypothetical protein